MWRLTIVGASALALGCGDDGAGAMQDAAQGDAASCVPASTVYLNFSGGDFTPGADDATTNQTSLTSTARTLGAWPHANTAEIRTCIENALAAFDIAVTETDPGTAPHHEIVFTTMYWDTGGVSSLSKYDCAGASPNSLTFVFANGFGTNAQDACVGAVSQFASASALLDHVTDCRDFLGIYSAPCGPKQWLSEAVTCGEGTPRACTCGGTTQASLPAMLATFGAHCQ